MAKKQLNLTYALKNNLLVHISDVERGKNCQCVCPACNEPLIAKKGEKVVEMNVLAVADKIVMIEG